MSQKPYQPPIADKFAKDAPKVPAHLLARNGAKLHDPSVSECLGVTQLDVTIARLECLMNELNGGRVISHASRASGRAAGQNAQDDPHSISSTQKSVEKTGHAKTQGRDIAQGAIYRAEQRFRVRGVL